MSFAFALAAAAAVSAPASQGVTSYPAAFFAPSQPTTALDMVNKLPGFTFDSGASVRGLADAAGNVLIDGARPAQKGDGLDQVLKRIPASQVARIDVIRGGAPGVDMQGKTILANVIRRADGAGHVVVAASATHAWDGRIGYAATAEAARRIGETSLEGSLLFGKGFDDGSGGGRRTARDGTGAIIGAGPEASAGAGYNYKATFAVETPALGGKLRLDSSVFSNPFDYTQQDSLTPAGSALEHDHQSYATEEVGLRYDRGLGARAKLEAYLFQQLGQSGYIADLADSGSAITLIQSGSRAHYSLSKQSSESIGRATVTFSPGGALAFETGAETDFNWLSARTSYVQDGVAQVIPAANVVVTEWRGDAFATATWQARRNLTLEASLRGEASRIAATGDVTQSKSLIYGKPRAVATWSPTGSDQVRLRLEREVSQLDFNNFAASQATLSDGAVFAGNPNIRPQTDWVAEAALDHRFWGAADLTFTFRHFWLSDVIDLAPVYTPDGDFDTPANIGPGEKTEESVSFTLPTDKLGIKRGVLIGTATQRWSRVMDPTTLTPRPITSLRPLDAELHFTQGLPAWKATWGFDIFNQWRQTTWRFDEIDVDKLKTYVVLFAEYRPRPDLVFRFEVENAAARGFEHLREVYQGPRNTSALAYGDLRDIHTGRILYLRARKTFG